MSATTGVTDELQATLEEFLRRYYHEDILELANLGKQSLEVELLDLYRFNNAIVDDLQRKPETVQTALNEALHQYDLPVDISIDDSHVRVVGWSDEDTHGVGQYDAQDIGSMVPVSGQVSKTSQKTPIITQAHFECLRCGTRNIIPQDKGDGLQEPGKCSGCEREGPYKLHTDKCEYRNRQLIRLQQPPEDVDRGAGATLDVVVNDDLVNTVAPGDRARIAGKLDIADMDDGGVFHLWGKSVEVEDSDFDEEHIAEYRDEIHSLIDGEKGDPYELLIESIAPRIHGEEYRQIKLALALQMFAANTLEYADGTDGRGRFHILILGDPGIGKSRLVEAVDELAPRSVFTSGEGVTKAGLTASVVPDDFGDGKWSLEAGPIVKANNGICCVDEIDKADEEAVEGLHTALEKQVVTISKASFSGVQLQARTSLLAAGNPKHGRFDPYGNVAEQIDLSPTLLSRFDLLFMMADNPEESKDRDIVRRIVEDRQDAIRYNRGDVDASETRANPPVEPELLRAWIAYIHQRDPKPVIEDVELIDRIQQFVVDLRQAGEGEELDNHVPITFRKVEAIMRLAEASARVRASETVEEQDVKRAVSLVLKSMRDVEYDPETGSFDADIVATGAPRSQQKRRQELREVIQEIQDNSSTVGAPEEEIYDRMKERGYDQAKIEHDIQDLRRKGEAYPPKDGELSLT